MKIKSAEFLIGATSTKQFPQNKLPEIAFAGRSNVGKSSLINVLVGRKQLARVGKQPGKTRQINFYEINGCFCFVDLPGFGYARVSQSEREAWSRLVESYFPDNRFLKGVIHLIDARHPDMQNDVMLSEFLFSFGIRAWIVATKIDKLSRNEQRKLVQTVKNLYKKEPVMVSARTGEGNTEVWKLIEEWIEA